MRVENEGFSQFLWMEEVFAPKIRDLGAYGELLLTRICERRNGIAIKWWREFCSFKMKISLVNEGKFFEF